MMLQPTQVQRPSLANAMRGGAVSVELEHALKMMHDALGQHDERITDMIFADCAGDRWARLSREQRMDMLADYAASQARMLGTRLR